MPIRPKMSLRFLDHCLTDGAGLVQLRQALERIEKCRTAVGKGVNLADVLSDAANQQSLAGVFGESEFDVGLQLCLRFGLESHVAACFTLTQPIDGRRKLDFIHRTVGGWQQFDAVISLCLPESEGHHSMVLVNPTRAEHWQNLDAIPAGTVVTIYVRGARGANSADDRLALSRYQAVFETVQHISDAAETEPLPSVRFQEPAAPAAAAPRTSAAPAPASKQAAPAPAANGAGRARRKPVASTVSVNVKRSYAPSGAPTGTPSFAFKVLINKMDTFVHAGNAQLICAHIKDYPGRIVMSALRAEKKAVSMDPDSIWSAEIRNGETVIFEFFGPVPSEEFVKELAKKVNKYTQMDKLAG
ncbi:MAG: hypothetical protein IT285_12925 [Bdellovibrionales bacterium]|nr:hypothetical protein [Bdellovibrionales bacterium]